MNCILSVKDKIEQFKRDCKSNDYYTKAVMECNERIEEIDSQLTGLARNGSNSPKCENAGNPYKENKLGLLVLQDQIINERNKYISRINDVNNKIMKVSDPIDRQMIIDLFIERKYYKNIVEKYHFNDDSSMYRKVNNVIKKIV